MHIWNGAVCFECAADGTGALGNAAGIDFGQCTVCKYYAVWNVPEYGKSDGGGGDGSGDGGSDTNALYACPCRTLGSGRFAGDGWRKAGSR